jgi:hypothetical protein
MLQSIHQNVMKKKMIFKDVVDQGTWNDFVYHEAYEGCPEVFQHKDQWEQAEMFVIDEILTEEQCAKLEELGII